MTVDGPAGRKVPHMTRWSAVGTRAEFPSWRASFAATADADALTAVPAPAGEDGVLRTLGIRADA